MPGCKPAAPRAEAFDLRAQGCTPYEAWQLEHAGYAEQDGLPWGAGLGPLLAAQADTAAADTGPVWLGELVHLALGTDRATLLDPDLMDLRPDEAEALFEAASACPRGFGLRRRSSRPAALAPGAAARPAPAHRQPARRRRPCPGCLVAARRRHPPLAPPAQRDPDGAGTNTPPTRPAPRAAPRPSTASGCAAGQRPGRPAPRPRRGCWTRWMPPAAPVTGPPGWTPWTYWTPNSSPSRKPEPARPRHRTPAAGRGTPRPPRLQTPRAAC